MSTEKTGAFDAAQLKGQPCPDCKGKGTIEIESENINENFEVEKQIVITECPRCHGSGFVPG
jgi:DnaJ-class molecular chaperone